MATASMAGAMVVALPGASANAAGDPMCSPNTTKLVWSNTKKDWVVTHRRTIENYTGAPASRTYSAQKVDEVTASVTITAGATVSKSLAMASLEVNVGLELQAAGTRTKTTAESITWTMSSGSKYVFYAGTRKASGYYTQYRCDRGTRWVNTGAYGKVESWTELSEGGLRCTIRPPAGSLAAKVKTKFC
ncbi:hypothetical protein [Streptomyces exfoliatus]|uniref:hypothetical protein n=1 Tax=Streptomyces exfoliatus TaxID=1905 RepID=UPI0012FED3BD|nr:hypothetical protein [Streptomyces exfoliatus]